MKRLGIGVVTIILILTIIHLCGTYGNETIVAIAATVLILLVPASMIWIFYEIFDNWY